MDPSPDKDIIEHLPRSYQLFYKLLKEAGMELSLKGELEKMKKEKEFD